ncbi:hypothetical protein NPIL_552561 [Nephila pilipes]|uniref:Uncharacterized protein n=1 Tax=Nephila pilipes TaxID=299642 RepID=A0A8X6Q1F4_NEPPI|nr:hypothetical protein NPIL_552561 [Nephila pilipes]
MVKGASIVLFGSIQIGRAEKFSVDNSRIESYRKVSARCLHLYTGNLDLVHCASWTLQNARCSSTYRQHFGGASKLLVHSLDRWCSAYLTHLGKSWAIIRGI